MIDPLLIEQYESADYYIEAIPPFILKIGIHSYELSKIYETSHQTKAALITASNPRSKKLPNEINKVRNKNLEEMIQETGLNYIYGEGKCGQDDWDGEESFLILGVDQKQAMVIGKAFDQNAIVWCGKNAIPELILLNGGSMDDKNNR